MDAWESLPEGKRLYCVGFMFSPYMEAVVLIRKKRPEWQRGLLNGIGGKLQDGETPLDGMRREFREEAGVAWDDWSPLARLDFPEATVWFFWARGDAWECRTQTDEEVSIHKTRDVQDLDLVPNGRWLIPMAVSFTRGERARCFTVQEVY
jgi:8-oxo-dGTP diphosphatase